MDRTVPKGAALLLEFVYVTETSKTPLECYDVIFGHRQSKLAKPLTSMTLEEVQRSQKYWASSKWAARFGSGKFSSAAGAAQFMRRTLGGLIIELRLSPSQRFDADLQDRLAYHLLKRRGYEDFIAGKIGMTTFAKNLACEWASLPVLTTTKGQKRTVQRGQSYYAGDGLNKALVAPQKVEAVLSQVLAAEKAISEREPSVNVDTPEQAPAGKGGALLAAIVAALAAAVAWLANLPCNLFNIFCGG